MTATLQPPAAGTACQSSSNPSSGAGRMNRRAVMTAAWGGALTECGASRSTR